MRGQPVSGAVFIARSLPTAALTWIALSSCCVAQAPSLLPTSPAPGTTKTAPLPAGIPPRSSPSAAPSLPDAPSTVAEESVVETAEESFRAEGARPVAPSSSQPLWKIETDPSLYRRLQLDRSRILSDQQFLGQRVHVPLTSSEKGFVAATNLIDVGNLLTLVGSSAYYVATTPHSDYGPGWKGFGLNVGYSLSQDATGEFFGTFAIPALAHQDPRYFRMPGKPIPRRILHAVSHTIIGQSDNGTPIPNYSILGTYPITAVISNLYVPGLHTDPRSTAARIGLGLLSDPSDALIGEFLPDVAKRLHIRIVFFQQILNNLNASPSAP